MPVVSAPRFSLIGTGVVLPLPSSPRPMPVFQPIFIMSRYPTLSCPISVSMLTTFVGPPHTYVPLPRKLPVMVGEGERDTIGISSSSSSVDGDSDRLRLKLVSAQR